MEFQHDPAGSPQIEQASSMAYLESRVREEADAAANASSIEATLIHLDLATAYARRFAIGTGRGRSSTSWADEIRVW